MSQAFSNIRILDFSQVIAGPYAAQLCSMLGAEVIKVEQPDSGDQMRTLMNLDNPRYPTMSPGFISYNAGKRSIAINLKAPDAHEVVTRLVKTCDVVVENFRAGVINKLGFGYEAIKAVKPDIVYCSISGYGQTGPEAGRPAYDGAVQAASGMMACTGHPETGPTRVSYLPIDITTGLTAAFAISSALYRRSMTGQGQFLDVAMLDAAVTLQSTHFARYLMGAPEPGLIGNSSPSKLPTANAFETADGHLLVACITEEQGDALFNGIGLGDKLADPKYQGSANRIENADEIKAAIGQVMKSRNSDDWIEILEPLRVPIAKVRDLSEVCSDPQMETRNIISTAPAPDGTNEVIPVIGAAFTTNIDGPVIPGAAPEVGQHNHEVLKSIGYSEAEIEGLDLT